jgi:hypothetical protein
MSFPFTKPLMGANSSIKKFAPSMKPMAKPIKPHVELDHESQKIAAKPTPISVQVCYSIVFISTASLIN